MALTQRASIYAPSRPERLDSVQIAALGGTNGKRPPRHHCVRKKSRASATAVLGTSRLRFVPILVSALIWHFFKRPRLGSGGGFSTLFRLRSNLIEPTRGLCAFQTWVASLTTNHEAYASNDLADDVSVVLDTTTPPK